MIIKFVCKKYFKIIFSFFILLFILLSPQLSVADESTYTLFESGQVRPLTLSPDGKTLFAINTPDNRLEAFVVTSSGIIHKGSVLVGMEPVAIAAKSNEEVWVVNHVSDSVSIVNVSKITKMFVERTLLVGDEPRDIVFAGKSKLKRAFITTAHRGQNSPIDPALITPGIGRADVWVFNADFATESSNNSFGGMVETIITLFMDTPRALVASADGTKVYVAGFKSGNQTTTIYEGTISAGGGVPGADTLVDTNGDGIPEPHTLDFQGRLQPLTGLIVKFDGIHWLDETGRIWDDKVKFSLPDKDVFVINAMANPPVQMAGSAGFYTSVGTTLFNMVVNPVNGKVYVSNTEALNHVRFEGPGIQRDGSNPAGTTVRGHIVESRITVLAGDDTPGDTPTVTPIHLNKHIDYSQCCDANPTENARSLAFPMGMAISDNGKVLYVAAFGSGKIGVFNTKKLENNSFIPDEKNQISLTGGGPSGLVIDKKNNRLYVLTRFDNSISIIDTRSNTEIEHITMYNPEPESIVAGRRFHYDASLTSAHGDNACASCHIFGDFDSLAWDLGNPDGMVVNNPGPLKINHEDFGLPLSPHFEPMKGPMTTQSMRGMANHGPMHWRGDRTGGNAEPSVQPNGGIYNEDLAFKAFNVAFPGLNGNTTMLTPAQMQAFTDFSLQITYPPNPVHNLDNSLTPDQQAGHDFFFDTSKVVDTAFNCNGCHEVDRNANAEFGVLKPGFFGTQGDNTFAFQQQFFKIPHLRNLYQKVGRFGMENNAGFLADNPFHPTDPFFGNENQFMGDQVRGFGFIHSGGIDTVFRFHNIVGFLPRPPGSVTPLDPGNPANLPITPEGMVIRRQLEQFLFVFDSNLFPIVGQQVTLTEKFNLAANERLDLMISRAELAECDLIASNKKGGYLYQGKGQFQRNKARKGLISDAKLRTKALPVTYTCVPPGNGRRIALDRDEDGFLDGDEISAGSDLANAASRPARL